MSTVAARQKQEKLSRRGASGVVAAQVAAWWCPVHPGAPRAAPAGRGHGVFNFPAANTSPAGRRHRAHSTDRRRRNVWTWPGGRVAAGVASSGRRSKGSRRRRRVSAGLVTPFAGRASPARAPADTSRHFSDRRRRRLSNVSIFFPCHQTPASGRPKLSPGVRSKTVKTLAVRCAAARAGVAGRLLERTPRAVMIDVALIGGWRCGASTPCG